LPLVFLRPSRLAGLKAFFQWLAGQPGFRSKLTYSDAEYFNPSANDDRIAKAARERPVASVDQIQHVLQSMPAESEAVTAVFPEAIVQTCIVHLLRNSMDFVSWKDRKNLAGALKAIYRATDADAAEKALTAFEAGYWGLALSRDRAELAARLGRGHPILRLSRRGPQDRLHHG